MQRTLYLIVILFSLVSCYTYQIKKPAEIKDGSEKKSEKNKALTADVSSDPGTKIIAENKNPNSSPAIISVNPQEKLAPGKNFRIEVDGHTHKIIVDRWEADSLVAHPVRRPKEILKFHKNQINTERIAEKRFSQPIADILTVLAYVGIGVGIYALVR